LFNQSVLLRGVNDDAAVLTELSEALFDAGVTPYYLHLLDRVQGAAHFEVDIETARVLHQKVRESLPGYLVPQLVREVAGEAFKRPVL
jgi:L-lysine 2,3-aminomutase